MRNFILGAIFGIVAATIGFSGMSALLDKGVEQVKSIAKEASK